MEQSGRLYKEKVGVRKSPAKREENGLPWMLSVVKNLFSKEGDIGSIPGPSCPEPVLHKR